MASVLATSAGWIDTGNCRANTQHIRPDCSAVTFAVTMQAHCAKEHLYRCYTSPLMSGCLGQGHLSSSHHQQICKHTQQHWLQTTQGAAAVSEAEAAPTAAELSHSCRFANFCPSRCLLQLLPQFSRPWLSCCLTLPAVCLTFKPPVQHQDVSAKHQQPYISAGRSIVSSCNKTNRAQQLAGCSTT